MTAIDVQYNKDITTIRELSVRNLKNYISAINEKIVIKYYLTWIDNYFCERLNHLSKNKPEKAWIFFIHNDFIARILQNKINSYKEYKVPNIKEYEDTQSLNEFKIIQYRFEDSSFKKLSKDESKKVFDQEGKQLFDKSQKADLKIDLLSIIAIYFFNIRKNYTSQSRKKSNKR